MSMVAGQLERYCHNNRLSFISSILVSAIILAAMWPHVPHETLLAWVGMLLLVQGGQYLYSTYYLRREAGAERQQAGWMSGLMVAALVTGLAWGSSFFMLGLSDEEPIAVLMIFVIAGITAYAGIAKSDLYPLAMAFEAAVLLPVCLWLFMQDSPVAHYMGIIALLYLLLLNYLLRHIGSMVQRVHFLANENSNLVAAQACDISERKKNLERLEQAQTIAKLGSWDWDVLANRVEWSEMAYEIYSPDERPEHPSFEEFRQSLHPDDQERVVAAVTSAFENDTPFDLEHRVVSESRGVRTVHAQGKVFRNEDGQPIRMVGTVQDISERKSMEAEIATREQEFRSLAESSPDNIIRYDLEHRILYLNKVLAELLGLSSTEAVIGKHPIEVWPDGRFAQIDEASARAIASGEMQLIELAAPDERGEPSYNHIYVVPERDAEGSIVGTLAFGRNVTHIRKTERKLSHFVDNLPGMAYTFQMAPDGAMGFTYVSPAIEKLFCLSEQEALDDFRAVHQFVPAEDMQRIESAISESARNLSPNFVEFRICCPGKPERWLDARSQPEQQADGSILWYGIMLDITERKRLEAEMADSHSFIEKVIDSITDPIFVKDDEHNLVLMNQAFCKMLGQPREVLQGRSDHVFLPPEQVEVFLEYEKRALKLGESSINEEVVTAGDGSTHYLQTKKDPFTFNNGRRYLVASVRDITERKRLEIALATREQEFRSLAESSPDSIVRVDREHRIRYVNDQLARFLGVDSPAELYGKFRSELPEHVRNDQIEAAEAEAMQSGEPRSIELEVPMDGGLVGYHHILVVPERDADGNIIGSIAFGRDMTHMKRMELALATREQEFRSLAESSPDFIVRVDRDLRIRYMNEILARFLGFDSPAEVYGKMRSDLPGYERSQEMVAAEAEAMQSGEPRSIELDFPREDGGVEYHHILVVPERDADGNIIGIISFGRVVTHMKRMELALATREEEFRSLAENSPDPIYRYDRNCRRIYANQAVERLSGFAREALLGKTPTECVPVPSVEATRVQQAIQSVLDSGQTAELEIAFVNAHGEDVSVHNVFVPEFDAAGEVKSVLCIGRDISERKVAEQALAEREAFLVSLLDAIPIPVFYKDLEGRYLGINRAFEHFFGAEREQLLGKSVFDTHPRELAETYHAKDVEVFERRVERQEYEFQIKHSNGTLRDVMFSKAAFTDAHDQVKGLIGAVMDITERKQAEIELQARFDDIVELNDRLTENTRLLEDQTVEMEATQEQIKQTEAWYRGILHSAPDGMMIIDPRGNITQVNIELARMFGYEAYELYGQSMEILLPTELRSSHVAMRDGFLRASKTEDIPALASNLRACRKDGSEFYVDVSLSRLPVNDYNPGEICAAVRDVTERRLAEEATRQSEVRFRTLYDSTRDAVMLLDEQGFFDCNATTLDMFGCATREAFCAKNPAELSPPVQPCGTDSQILANQYIARAMQDGGLRFEWVHRRADTEECFSADVLLSLMVLDGKPILQATVRDITERKQNEVVMEEMRQRLQTVVQTIPDLVWLKDVEGVYLSCNSAFERFFGASESAIVGKTDYDFVDKELADFFRQKDQDAIVAGGMSMNEEWVTMADNGEHVLLETRKVPVYGAEGRVVGVLGVGRDITARKRMEEELRRSEYEFRALVENLPDPFFRYDRDHRRTYVNAQVEKLTGKPAASMLGLTVKESKLASSYWNDVLDREVQCVLDTGEPSRYAMDFQTPEGELKYFDCWLGPVSDEKSETDSVMLIMRDTTERKLFEMKLAEREREFRTLVENSADTVARHDRDLRRVYANPAFGELVEGGVEALIGKLPSEVPGGEGGLLYEEKLHQVLASGEAVEFELKWVNKAGQDVYSLINLTPEFDEEGHVASVLAVGRDITELYTYRQKIHRMAFFDPLTALPNRALFNDRLRQMIADASWHGQLAGVMMIDMDRFKTVNDTMGHAVGDELLRETGRRLSTCVRAYDTVARLGGDEFAVLLPDVRSGDDLGTIADKMRSVFDAPFLLEGKEVFISCSIGIALYPDDSIDAEDLVKYADSAMYYAKRSGRNNFRFYANNLTESANERLTLESELRHALERNEFSLHFQPKVCLEKGMMIGSEALLRWQRPQHGFVSPDKFIPIAEDSGLIVELGEWVLREACRIACEMNGVGRSLHKVAINLSARQFMSNDLVETVTRVLEETGCYPEWIELEITESLLLDEYGEVLETLKAFRALGITIAIDDFGTGYSALSYLARFPINTLKIDRSFINTMTTDKYCAELVKAILSIASSLGQQVVAEGVETDEQALFLQTHNCEVAQGYLFSKPVPWEELLALSGNYELERPNKSSKLISI
jgi:diguanylate cyclase (GGDEF)-like protein/PAS domain S-box-containing protein